MLRRLFALLSLCLFPSAAAAAPVVMLGPGGHASVRQDLYLPPPERALPATRAAHIAARPQAKARMRAPERTVRSELLRLYHSHAIDLHSYRGYRGSFERALTTARRLSGTRAAELQSVLANLHGIATAGLLTSSRLPVLFLTLDRNRRWWTTGPLLASGQRVEFAGSEIVWEYYPGQGIELQQLGSFGKADGLYTGGRSLYPRMRRLLAELVPLGVQRGGGLAWEYYFSFDGGVPPWTSAMSQATALEALTRASVAFHDPTYLEVARQALPLFHAAPPTGVATAAPAGIRFLLYSFAPGAHVINGFLQALIGLYDYAHASGSADAAALFSAGDAEARRELPAYDTGGWSLYQPGVIDSLDYHRLVTGFLHGLCTRTKGDLAGGTGSGGVAASPLPAARSRADAYCTTARRFDGYLTRPPDLALRTHNTVHGLPTTVRFSLSKPAHVGIVVVRDDGVTVFSTSADFDGDGSFQIGSPSRPGIYTVRLAGTDLAGNFHRIVDSLNVH